MSTSSTFIGNDFWTSLVFTYVIWAIYLQMIYASKTRHLGFALSVNQKLWLFPPFTSLRDKFFKILLYCSCSLYMELLCKIPKPIVLGSVLSLLGSYFWTLYSPRLYNELLWRIMCFLTHTFRLYVVS